MLLMQFLFLAASMHLHAAYKPKLVWSYYFKKHCKCPGKHLSFLMLGKKGSSRDRLPREQKEELVLQTVALKRNNNLYPKDNKFNYFFSLGGWNIRVEPVAAQLLGQTVGWRSEEAREPRDHSIFTLCFSLWCSGEFGGCTCWHLHSPEPSVCQQSSVLQGWPTSPPTCCSVREHDWASHPEKREEKAWKN